mgnify:CR=1 FL=1
MINRLVYEELEKLGLRKLKEELPYELYFKCVNDVIQTVKIDMMSNKREVRLYFDIIPLCTDKNYFGRPWEYELKEMRNGLSVLDTRYNIVNSPDYYKEIINDIDKYIKPIFDEFNKTEKLLKLYIVLDNKIHGFDRYPDYRKLAAALKVGNYEYGLLILLYLKYDYVVWGYRRDLTQFIDFSDIDLKKYTSFNYDEDEFIKKLDLLIHYTKDNNIKKINEYLEENKRNIFKYFKL